MLVYEHNECQYGETDLIICLQRIIYINKHPSMPFKLLIFHVLLFLLLFIPPVCNNKCQSPQSIKYGWHKKHSAGPTHGALG